jgi:hypothetical protein
MSKIGAYVLEVQQDAVNLEYEDFIEKYKGDSGAKEIYDSVQMQEFDAYEEY